jgi:predicted TIM-barrel fold metal-dependent hydrolase
MGPGSDEDVRSWTSALGLPGLVDVHTHFLPPPVMTKVRAQFDAAGPLIGRPWPLHYRDTDEALVEVLRSLGVARFTALPYAHRPGMADWLNEWAAGFAARVPEAAVCGTFYPEESASAYVAARLASVEVFKVHVQVGGFDPRHRLLAPVWERLEETGTPVVIHCGSGPLVGHHTGPEPVTGLLERHPRLQLVIAHLGMPEYRDFLELAERYERVHLDTTMFATDFTERLMPFDPTDLPRLAALREKVLLGSDFPSIPYPYAHQLAALHRLDLGEDWLRAVLWHNGARLFRIHA